MNDEKDNPKSDDWGMTMPHLRLEKDKNADDFSEDYAPLKKSANQKPSDDWGMTQQNFNLPDHQTSSDFDKTSPNVEIPKDIRQDETPRETNHPPADDWGMTTPNINLAPEKKQSDWEATAPNINIPQENKSEDWGMTVPSVNAPKQDKKDEWSMPAPVFRRSEGEKLDDVAKRTGFFNLKDLDNFDKSPQKESDNFDKTTPNFNFSEVAPPGEFGKTAPENLDLRPQPDVSGQSSTVQSAIESKPTAQPGNSKIIYIVGGLLAMLLFVIVFSVGTYFLFFYKSAAAKKTEPVKEEQNETVTSPAAPPVSSETVLPKAIEYKGAMVLVSAGEFSMGSDAGADESKPAHKVALAAYYIDKTEVTNGAYKAFCDATGKTYPPNPHLEKDYFLSRPNAPVVGVSFADAKAYADWAGKRLPTEEEWEKAASWDEAAQAKREFPWGNDFQKNNVAFGTPKISDVGKFTAGASPVGAMDMAGNVLEWVDAFFQPYPGSPSSNAEFGEKNRVARGGHFASKSSDSLKTTKRIYVSPDIASGEDDEKLVAAIIGFRCAVSADDSRVADVLQKQGK